MPKQVKLPEFEGQFSAQGDKQRRLGIPQEIWVEMDKNRIMDRKNLKISITVTLP